MSTTDTPLTSSRAPGGIGIARKAKAYLALTKPRVIELLLVSTLPTMIYAERGFPSIGLILATLVGGAFAAGSAGAFNCYIDRDIDKLMHRTENRPLVTGEVTPREALIFSWLLGAAAIGILWVGANPLAAWLGLAAIFFYVVIYTIILKRRTAQNIVWGGAAGCFPVLIAWAAVTGSVEWPAVILFMVIFLWTPPHYWPLSMKVKEDYARVGVPMLPVMASNKVVAKQIVLYSWVMVGVSLLLTPMGYTGWFYTAVALAAGGWWLWEAHALLNRAKAEVTGAKLKEMRLFHWSITYVSLLFVAVAVDPFLR